MNSFAPKRPQKNQRRCNICGSQMESGETYHHRGKILCEDCCLDMRMPRARKTHWQYLRSIKREYLRPAAPST